MKPDHPPPTHRSTSLGTRCFRGFLRGSPSSTPRVSPTAPPGLPQGAPSMGTSSLGTPPLLQALPCPCPHLGWPCHVSWHTQTLLLRLVETLQHQPPQGLPGVAPGGAHIRNKNLGGWGGGKTRSRLRGRSRLSRLCFGHMGRGSPLGVTQILGGCTWRMKREMEI